MGMLHGVCDCMVFVTLAPQTGTLAASSINIPVTRNFDVLQHPDAVQLWSVS